MKAVITRIHLWAGLILGTQVFVWMMSGVVMSWFHIDWVRGATTTADTPAPAYSLEQPYFPIEELPVPADSAIRKLSLTRVSGQPAYRIVFENDDLVLFNAHTGVAKLPLTEDKIREIAKTDFSGRYKSLSLKLMSKTPYEYRRALPVWQVQFDDRDATRLYISPTTGEILSRRNRIWRIYDFFWMLHIMDYEERENFNNIIVRTFSGSGLIFAITGVWLVIWRLRAGRYGADMKLLRQKQKAD